MKTLFVAWQDLANSRWLPVGRLTRKGGKYTFVYTKGAKKSKNFKPFGGLKDLTEVYESEVLFPLFANRILPKSRPEYSSYLHWLGLTDTSDNEIEMLARTGGLRATDTLQLLPCPEPTRNNSYKVYFFSHGVRHLPPDHRNRINELVSGQRLFLMRDIQNPFDRYALLMRTDDPISIVGYCPRYYSADFTKLIRLAGQVNVSVTVEKVNADAPMQMRLLCKLHAPWPSSFSACSTEEYKPLRAVKDYEEPLGRVPATR